MKGAFYLLLVAVVSLLTSCEKEDSNPAATSNFDVAAMEARNYLFGDSVLLVFDVTPKKPLAYIHAHYLKQINSIESEVIGLDTMFLEAATKKFTCRLKFKIDDRFKNDKQPRITILTRYSNFDANSESGNLLARFSFNLLH